MSAVEMIPHLTAAPRERTIAQRAGNRDRRRRRSSAGELKEIGVGMLGYAFMGKAHSNAFHKLAYMTWPPPLVPRLVAIAGRNEQAVARGRAALRLRALDDRWRDLVADERIGLFDNGGPNALHAEPTIAAAEAGKHVLCEKPLGRTATRLRHLGARRRDRRQAHVRLQLSLRACRAPRAGADPGRASSARSGTSAAATSRTGATIRRSTRGASIPTRRAPARSATSART